jgi:peptidoglycan hydrolase-like protein with peptidoglycan-binding domain
MAVIAAVSGLVVVGRNDPAHDSAAAKADVSTATRRTAQVTRRDLADTVDGNGMLGYGDQRAIRGSGNGIITALPKAGTVIEPDQPLYGVDGHAGPILLNGSVPMWRPLHSGVADGADVAELEGNLAYLGFAANGITVDGEFTSQTTKTVKAWQKAHGLDETGNVNPADVEFSAAPIRVAATNAQVGDRASGDILTVTGIQRLVHIDLDAKYSQFARTSDSVDLKLSDDSSARGTITSVATTATVVKDPQSGSSTASVAIEVTPATNIEALDESPVTVTFTTDKVSDVLAVPVDAVVATADGRYTLEVVDGAGPTHLADVKLGRFAGGWVQVTGQVEEGQTVVTA